MHEDVADVELGDEALRWPDMSDEGEYGALRWPDTSVVVVVVGAVAVGEVRLDDGVVAVAVGVELVAEDLPLPSLRVFFLRFFDFLPWFSSDASASKAFCEIKLPRVA